MIKTSSSKSNLQGDLIRAQLINSKLHGTIDLRLCDSIGSTSDFVMSNAVSSSNDYLVCVANHQTEGRGRNGRQWHSPANSNIYMSVGYQLSGECASSLGGLSLACGVSIAKVVSQLGVQPQLKWPNDILVSGRKLAGILVETRIKGREIIVVIGLGLNVAMPDITEDLIDQPWTDLRSNIFDTSVELDKNRLVAKLIMSLVSACNVFNQEGIKPFLKDWSKYDVLKGQDVWVQANGREECARVIGLNEDCSLRVDVAGYEKSIYAADVKIKLKK